MDRQSIIRSCLIGGLLILSSGFVTAQNLNQLSPQGNGQIPTYYYMGRSGELTIIVNLWGAVRNPGRYEIPSSTDLIQLISLGGGPVAGAKLNNVRIVHNVTNDSTIHRRVESIDIDHILSVGSQSPLLYPGDTVVLDESKVLDFDRVFGYVRDFVLLAVTIVTFVKISK